MAEEQTEIEGVGSGEDESGKRPRKSHRQRAVSSLRTAKRQQRELTEQGELAQFLLAEAEALALLNLADAIRGTDGDGDDEA